MRVKKWSPIITVLLKLVDNKWRKVWHSKFVISKVWVILLAIYFCIINWPNIPFLYLTEIQAGFGWAVLLLHITSTGVVWW